LDDTERWDIGRGAALIGQIAVAEKMVREINKDLTITGLIYSAIGVFYFHKKEFETAKKYF
jgi:hypothetical protein